MPDTKDYVVVLGTAVVVSNERHPGTAYIPFRLLSVYN